MQIRALKRHDTLGMLAPASPTNEEDLKKAEIAIKELGFKVIVGESCYARRGYLSGDDHLRASDVNKMFVNEDIDGIICLRGGYGSMRILDMLDFDIIKDNPKPFIGYSDITALLVTFFQRAKMPTFHGPMGIDFAKGLDEFTKNSFISAVCGSTENMILSNPEGRPLRALSQGEAEGEIVGGNLSIVAATLGTPYEIDTRGKLLLLEDIDEKPYKVDKMLLQMRLAGKLEEAAGFILGDFRNCEETDASKSLNLEEVFADYIIPLRKPTIANFSAGHCDSKITVPIGLKAHLDATNCKICILKDHIAN
ncbi:muramoyltetrapeptide carboxypeptidase [Acetomicrobium thermoterrenum DSM 13490]|uniref:Muramoyltetrapeptide carboxypeptidase n=1 Tax=Acetomicrobium thermoterrenum DSM 13490 TaxID=1120987 RepID=A0A1H3EBQ8_9BACT|nr:LD-carboxypeptidase [Acetomicrobium thermoterrenum]SDX76105.1 muramoyltetrapeptide carboxypeptidase [Acetomicrobium thermoterrenum DSM 13490]